MFLDFRQPYIYNSGVINFERIKIIKSEAKKKIIKIVNYFFNNSMKISFYGTYIKILFKKIKYNYH